MRGQNFIRLVLFIVAFSVGVVSLGLAILVNDLIRHYHNRQLLAESEQLSAKLRQLNTDYEALLKQLREDPNHLKRIAPAAIGAERDDPAVQKAVGILLNHLPQLPKQDGDKWRPGADIYLWYHGSLALSRLGGQEWKVWNHHAKQVLLKLQGDDGSWETNGDRWREHGGKLYFTALSLLALEVYYRYD